MTVIWKDCIRETRLLTSEFSVKRDRDLKYLTELKEENLLFPFYEEAGLNGRLNYRLGPDVHGGWDSPLSQIRGTFTGHWLSAAARLIQETGHTRLRAKADFIVSEIARCQQENGGEWAFSIPEKYLLMLKQGKHFWAPQYVCHKVMMGLFDMYLYGGNEQAQAVLGGCADWFVRFAEDITPENMEQMMDEEETGGIMELWADLYSVTGREEHLKLARRYERRSLTEPVLLGEDILTNMHANATIPEIHGCARMYEVTGEERYLKIVENYWKLAVTDRGAYATGGQTDGEIWGPPGRQASRLGDMNQEHCVVYNMIRLADYLFRVTGESSYGDYIESNIQNGLLAQGFFEARVLDGALTPHEPDSGIVCYYLPLEAGGEKKWGRRTEDFWCCHGTAVQANAKLRDWIWYRRGNEACLAQLIPSQYTTQINGKPVTVSMRFADLGGNYLKLYPIAAAIREKPDYIQAEIEIDAEEPVDMVLRIRLPWWMQGKAQLFCMDTQRQEGVNTLEASSERLLAAQISQGEHREQNYTEEAGYAVIRGCFRKERFMLRLYKKITAVPLTDDPQTMAFLDGPVLLSGLTDRSRTLTGDLSHPERLLRPHHEREWESWKESYSTVGQEQDLIFKPLKEIGREKYTVYFPVRQKEHMRYAEIPYDSGGCGGER